MGDLLRCNLTRLILESLMIIPRSNKILKQMSLSLRDSNAIVNMFMCYFFCSNQSEAHCHIDKIPILWPFLIECHIHQMELTSPSFFFLLLVKSVRQNILENEW